MKNYEEQMIEAWAGPKLSKQVWYKRAFAKYKINGVEKYAFNWSWWGFFFGPFFLLTRKDFVGFLIYIGVYIMMWFAMGEIASFIIAPWGAAFCPYFLFKKYSKMKKDIESTVKGNEKRIETMRKLTNN